MSEGSTAKRVRRSKAEQRAETLNQILDAAEALFSKHGLHGVTLRDVADAYKDRPGKLKDSSEKLCRLWGDEKVLSAAGPHDAAELLFCISGTSYVLPTPVRLWDDTFPNFRKKPLHSWPIVAAFAPPDSVVPV